MQLSKERRKDDCPWKQSQELRSEKFKLPCIGKMPCSVGIKRPQRKDVSMEHSGSAAGPGQTCQTTVAAAGSALRTPQIENRVDGRNAPSTEHHKSIEDCARRRLDQFRLCELAESAGQCAGSSVRKPQLTNGPAGCLADNHSQNSFVEAREVQRRHRCVKVLRSFCRARCVHDCGSCLRRESGRFGLRASLPVRAAEW